MNKELERKIVETIFRSATSTLRSHEAPDFVLECDGKACLGIEVTEFFPDESQARLDRMPNYAVQLLNAGSVRHKDDRNLRIEMVTYTSGKTGESRKINAIIHTVPPPNEALTNLRKAIRQKDAKHIHYAEYTRGCDLVINDACLTLRSDSATSLLQTVGRHPIRRDLLGSGFRDVILCTSTDNGKCYFIPLKASLFASYLFTFVKLITGSRLCEAYTPEIRFGSLCTALLASGFQDIKAWLDGQSVIFRYASVDVALNGRPLAFVDNTKVAESSSAEPLSHACVDDHDVRTLAGHLLRSRRKERWYVALAA